MASDNVLLESIRDGLIEVLGDSVKLQWVSDLSGGDINQAALIRGGGTNWFLKYHGDSPGDMFATEAQALAEMAALDCIRVPKPVAMGKHGKTSWLVMEYLDLTSSGPASLLGKQLAAMHTIDHKRYGWSQNNYIGTTPQDNACSGIWCNFWRDMRLKPQLDLARVRGFGGRLQDKGEKLLASMDQLMDGHQPAASLLHGDLWAGNKAYTRQGQPVIFDPASYHGDRETDIAMTELFGGFEPSFYSAYKAHSPLPDGYQLRRDLYNLYHVLNHLNLFGSAYLSRCVNMIDRLLAEIH